MSNFDFKVNDEHVTYKPWTDGHAVGFRCEYDDGHVEYIYLNPSVNEGGEDSPNVFLYKGPSGDPGLDSPSHHYTPLQEPKGWK